MKPYRHFHDYYSRTYPRYESYTSPERERDLVDMINVIYDNKSKIFEHNLYYDISGGLNPVFKTNVLCAVGDQISSSLSSPIIQTITMILSSPEAEVALCAPVVNLIANSKEIHTQTVNVVGNALSTGVLSNEMTESVKQTIYTTEVREAVTETVGDALVDDKLSDEMNYATSKAITDPSVSSAMTESVANVIPTDEVSSAVNDVVRIEKIVGNKDEKFTDNNKNGTPDEYEDNQVGLIFGDLGA